MKKIYQPSALGSQHLLLSKTAKKLLVIIQGLELQYREVYPSQSWLAKKLGRSREWICKSVSELVQLGFITATPQKEWNTLVYSARLFILKVKARSKKLAIYKRTQAKIKRKITEFTQYPTGSGNCVSNSRRVVCGETAEKETILYRMGMDQRSRKTLLAWDDMRSVSDFKALRDYVRAYAGQISSLGAFCYTALQNKYWE